jgi:hypothetical protein
MKLVRHGATVIAIIERRWEKDFLSLQRNSREWVPLFPVGGIVPLAEINTITHEARLCEGQVLIDQQEVELHSL